jgi:hypothetical protein
MTEKLPNHEFEDITMTDIVGISEETESFISAGGEL